ncbi:hypothetical protein GUITHDRAFT_143675 [Guillardia theta CCMP2712]|uniref:Uncharacterized protein n=1 Tax=Guillardia theta (strain CCMP2712) TaxID=905079 RepID=L1ITT9_GUITC|nr:hypothetical protein GUITHDRAFT_143675 [Guillardia theta CCMP2712]EKX39274.1 hypothetical protein GUITHDRAFT_143675 [Guillardia theta CCMP2712]|eukprot:XP_005826254.1 hypothetical protein GUITHDRAFT_143675 [Guillardia theta CCMP2712]
MEMKTMTKMEKMEMKTMTKMEKMEMKKVKRKRLASEIKIIMTNKGLMLMTLFMCVSCMGCSVLQPSMSHRTSNGAEQGGGGRILGRLRIALRGGSDQYFSSHASEVVLADFGDVNELPDVDESLYLPKEEEKEASSQPMSEGDYEEEEETPEDKKKAEELQQAVKKWMEHMDRRQKDPMLVLQDHPRYQWFVERRQDIEDINASIANLTSLVDEANRTINENAFIQKLQEMFPRPYHLTHENWTSDMIWSYEEMDKACEALVYNNGSSVLNSKEYEMPKADLMLNFHVAAAMGSEKDVNVFLQMGADINEQGPKGLSALHLATLGDQDAMVKWLIGRGANMEAKAEDGRTCMQIAAMAGNKQIIQTLHQAGANVNAIDDHSRTALHSAAAFGSMDAAETLGSTALDYARRNEHNDIVLYLSSLPTAGK